MTDAPSTMTERMDEIARRYGLGEPRARINEFEDAPAKVTMETLKAALLPFAFCDAHLPPGMVDPVAWREAVMAARTAVIDAGREPAPVLAAMAAAAVNEVL